MSRQTCSCCIGHTLAQSLLPVVPDMMRSSKSHKSSIIVSWKAFFVLFVLSKYGSGVCFVGELDPITLRPFPQPIVQIPAQVSPLETSSSQNQMRPWRPQRHSSDGKLSGGNCQTRSPLLAYCVGSKSATGVYLLGLGRVAL